MNNTIEYRNRLASAIQWIQENPMEKLVVAGRIFKVQPDSIQMALKRAKRKDKKTGRRGHNKVLSETQTEAIQGYCKEQYESGMGATKQMVFAAISHLMIQAEPLRKPLSWRWF